MTPLLGWTLSGMAAVSLLLCVALAVLWIRSDWRAEFWTYKGAMYGPRYRTSVQVNSVAGMAIIDYSGGADGPRAIGDEPSGFEHKKGAVINGVIARAVDQINRSVVAHDVSMAAADGSPYWNHLGSFVWMPTSSSVEIFVPYWQIVLVTGILPATRVQNVWRWRRQKNRRSKGLCLACGYDLRATPQRCPECGTIVR
jgi:hypothetical protein